MTRQAGFTLVELLLSVAIMGLLSGITLPVYQSYVRRGDLDITAQNLALALRRAETYARAVNYDTAWSVEVQAASITVFRGTVFGSRNTAFDEVVAVPGSITPSGLAEVQFAPTSAAPNTSGAITLTSSTNDTRVITINAKGVVSY